MPPPNTAFRALADPTRREILKLLRGGAKSSGDIAAHFSVSWPTISRHLAVLRDAGMIVAEREGNSISYELNTTVFHELVEHVLDLVGAPSPQDKARRSDRAARADAGPAPRTSSSSRSR